MEKAKLPLSTSVTGMSSSDKHKLAIAAAGNPNPANLMLGESVPQIF